MPVVGLVWVTLWSGVAGANDGLDRYRGPTCTELRLFTEPSSPRAGYRMLSRDLEGGADGDRAFRWARDLGVAVVRLAARQVAINVGSGPYPMAIFDLSSENGDTPVAFADDAAPRGRHPGGSHDGGWNLDLGYYLTSVQGQRFTPDLAPCSEHWSGEDDAWQCTGPADRLDVDRQALFLLELIRMHHEQFGDGLIEEIGMDARIQRSVLRRLDQWAGSRQNRATRPLVRELRRRLTADRFDGWARAHHHHLHLRLQRIEPFGPRRAEVDQVLAAERELDEELAPGRGPVIRARLRSCGLRRRLELRLARSEGVRRCEYRVAGSDWTRARRDGGGFRHVIDLSTRPGREGNDVLIDARITVAEGEAQERSLRLRLPRQDPELAVEIHPEQIRPRVEQLRGGESQLWLDLPRAYQLYITAVRWEFIPREGDPIRGQSHGSGSASRPYAVQLTLPAFRGEVVVGEVEVELAGRQRLRLPVLPVGRGR